MTEEQGRRIVALLTQIAGDVHAISGVMPFVTVALSLIGLLSAVRFLTGK